MTTLAVEPLFVVRYGEIERGSDLWHLRADDVVELDVRAMLRTHDGAAIAMRYTGLCTVSPADAEALRAGREPQGPFSDRKAIRFETGAAAGGPTRSSAGRTPCPRRRRACRRRSSHTPTPH